MENAKKIFLSITYRIREMYENATFFTKITLLISNVFNTMEKTFEEIGTILLLLTVYGSTIRQVLNKKK